MAITLSALTGFTNIYCISCSHVQSENQLEPLCICILLTYDIMSLYHVTNLIYPKSNLT